MPKPRRISLTEIAGLCCALVLAAALARPAAAQDAALGIDAARQRALELVNESRRAQKLPPLALEPKLNQAAMRHALDMLKRNFYAHNTPEGKTPADRYQAVGGSKWMLTAENIARCETCRPPVTDAVLRRLQDGWMNSPGHRANILRKGLTTFGYGIVMDAKGGMYAVQNFAGPGTSDDAKGPADGGKAIPQEEQAQLALEAINKERGKAGRAPLKFSQALTQAARALAPPSSVSTFGQQKPPPLFDLMPDSERENWDGLAMVAAICGGCGLAPAAADVGRFTAQWFRNPSYSETLLDAESTHLGFTVSANGEGKKVGIGLLGKAN
ncbi:MULTISPECIES: CAP domain-containing protein [Rhodomicrobium]|uniref:CAP domain-containing protein n=1 Tax=Rhodomicrobium TaxID=1068 RepID=UPI000B4BE219|nr:MULTISPECIES: CAP domain-containing protein [Rhodomicrobium]